jgi:plastocyanin
MMVEGRIAVYSVFRPLTAGIVLAAVSGLGATGSSQALAQHQASVAASKTATVKVNEAHGKYQFATKTLKIKVGTTVTWANSSDAAHTVSSKAKGLFNKSLKVKGKVSFTFNKAGTYTYTCHLHTYMHATVIVSK